MSERDQRLAEIRERHAASTPGEWFYNGYSMVGSTYFVELEDSEPDDTNHEEVVEFNYVCTVPPSYGDTATGIRVKNAQFIAEAHQDIPWLLAEIERLYEALDAIDVRPTR